MSEGRFLASALARLVPRLGLKLLRLSSTITHHLWFIRLLLILLTTMALAQETSVVPALVTFRGTLIDVRGKPLVGAICVRFYSVEAREDQSATADRNPEGPPNQGATTRCNRVRGRSTCGKSTACQPT